MASASDRRGRVGPRLLGCVAWWAAGCGGGAGARDQGSGADLTIAADLALPSDAGAPDLRPALDLVAAPGRDCRTGLCGATSTCITEGMACHDQILDARESDVDCGGPLCSACSSGSTCRTNTDCDSGFCDARICL